MTHLTLLTEDRVSVWYLGSSEHKSLQGEAELLCFVKAESAANVRHAANRMYELENIPGCGYTCNHCCDLHGHV